VRRGPLLAGGMMVLALTVASAARPLQAGDPAPALALRDLDGHALDLAGYRGKVVLLDFWATWCVPCREEIPHLIALQRRYGSRGLAIIGISMDDEEAPVREFRRKYGMNYPVAMGNVEVAERYGGILGLPVAFLIDRDGRIVRRYDGQQAAATFEKDITGRLAR